MSTVASSPGHDAQVSPISTMPDSARPGNIAVNKSSRARPNKHQYGWGNLPVPLIHKVLSYVIEATQVPHGLATESDTIPLVLLRRQWMSQTRQVSAGWRSGVDSHPFWRELVETFTPASIALNESTRPWFLIARATSANMCVPCMLYGTHPGSARCDKAVPTAKLGVVPTCQYHMDTFCINCMAYKPGGRGLECGERQDFDEEGRLRPEYPLLCTICRIAAIESAILRILVDCARTGLVYGAVRRWSGTTAYKEYTVRATGQSTAAARSAVEEMFLIDNTRWTDFEPLFWEIQMLFFKCKVLFYQRRVGPSQDDINLFNGLVYDIWADDDDIAPRNFDLGSFYGQWLHEFDVGIYQDAECQEDIERYHVANPLNNFDPRRMDMNRRLSPALRDTLVEHCIRTWCVDRVNSGLWILPSDEIRQHLDPSARVHSDINTMARASVCPDVQLAGDNEHVLRAHEQRLGRFLLPSGPVDQDRPTPFLAPHWVLQRMDAVFSDVLTARLVTPLNEIVQVYRAVLQDDAQAERVCSEKTLGDILETLHGQHPWTEGAMVNDVMSKVIIRSPSKAARDTPSAVSSSSLEEMRDEYTEQELGMGPRIEVVQRAATPEFGVVEGWSSHPSDDDIDEREEEGEEEEDLVPSSTLSTSSEAVEEIERPGKRKDVDGLSNNDGRASRPRAGSPGSGQTSTSGDSASTALVTPDESPKLDSEVHVVAEASDAASTVILSVSEIQSPAHSPKLGKRKSPDDDDLDHDKPLQRRRSRTTTLEEGDGAGGSANNIAGQNDQPQPDAQAKGESAQPSPTVAEPASAVPPSNRDARSTSPERVTPTESNKPSSPEGEGMVSLGPEDFVSTQSSPRFAESEYSSRLSGIGDPVMVPYVPPKWAELGPGATEVIHRAWIAAQDVLKECKCTICVRAQRQAMTRMLFDDDTQLRIA